MLETLHPKFNRAFLRSVGMNEITKFSIQLSKKYAVVLTNKSLYIITRKLILKAAVDVIEVDKISSFKIEGEKLKIRVKDSDQYYDLNVDSIKIGTVKKVINKFNI